jgi:hypothetical protein
MAGEPAASGDIVVVSVRGDVRVTMSGAPRAVQAGSVVELPATIRTGHDGAIDLRQGKTTVAIAADSELRLPATAQQGAIIDVLIQTRGNAFYDVGKRESRKLRVETPYLVAVIKGTQFNVAVQEDSATISLFEGRLEVRTPDGSDVVDLNAGEIAIRHATDKTIRVLRMDNGKAPATTSNDGKRSVGPASPDDGSGTSRGNTPIDNGGLVVGGRIVPPGSDNPLEVDVRTNAPSAGISLEAGNGALEAGANAKLGDGLSVQIEAAAATADVLANAEVSLGAGTADIGAAAAVDLGVASVDTTVDAGVDLGAGAASVAVDASVDLGAAAADLGAGAAVDLGAGTVDLTADVGADLGAAAVDAGLDASVDLGAGAVDAGAGAAADLGLAAVDTSIGAGLDPTGVGVDAALDTSVVGVDLGADVGVDLGTGGLGLDVELGGLDIGLGTDPVATPAPTAAPAPPLPDLGGLLGGLLGGRRSN